MADLGSAMRTCDEYNPFFETLRNTVSDNDGLYSNLEVATSGGLYWWTHFFASPKTRNALSFLVGYSNTIGLVGGLCS
jgi:hypothetical protein